MTDATHSSDSLAPIRAVSPQAADDIELFTGPIAYACGILKAIADTEPDPTKVAIIRRHMNNLLADAERLATIIAQRNRLPTI